MTLNFRFVFVNQAEILLRLTSRGRIIFHLSLFDFYLHPTPSSKI